ncbi:MAG TPA: nitrilase-related carbon-nitrogen hydrolase, partial [Actinomycetales bacterium]|nr:nitrilase-related carbon-nitrogen hydrolase [Actinomycetales bacterium]
MPIRVAMAQLATRVGDIDGNVAAIRAVWHEAAGLGADLVVFTELAITGYPPEDLLLKPEFLAAADAAVTELAATGPHGTVAVFGTVGRVGTGEPVDDGNSGEMTSREITVSAGQLRNRAVVV